MVRALIRELYTNLVKTGILSKRPVFAQLNRFFSTDFTTIIEFKERSYLICRDLPRFQIKIREELADKKTGLLLASNSQLLFESAEANASRYARTFEGLWGPLAINQDQAIDAFVFSFPGSPLGMHTARLLPREYYQRMQ